MVWWYHSGGTTIQQLQQKEEEFSTKTKPEDSVHSTMDKPHNLYSYFVIVDMESSSSLS
jgi:DNA replication protein DnaD